MVQINSAEANRASVRYIIETEGWGTTPATGLTREMRITSSGLVASKETKISDELRADRMVPSVVETSAASGGPVSWEFSAFSQDDLFQHGLLGVWTTPMLGLYVKGVSVRVTDTDEVTLSGTDYTNWLVAGRFIKLEGFSNLENNGYFEIVSAAFIGGNTVIQTAETTLVAEAGSAFTKCVEGNDVILKADDIELAVGNVIDGGPGAFAGKRLYVGQKIRLEGLGREVGTVQAAATDPVEGALITINDGVETIVFEVRTVAGLVAEGNIHVPLNGTPATMAANLRAAIQQQFTEKKFQCFAEVTTDTVTVYNGRNTGGSLTTSDAVGFTVANFAGGSASKNGFYTIAALPDDSTIVTVEPLTADTNAGGATVLILGSHLRNPGVLSEITKQSMSTETSFNDVNKHFLQNGMRSSGFTLNVEAGEIVTGETTFMGRQTIRSSVPVLGNAANYDVLPTTSTEVLNATANVGQVSKNGVQLSKAIRAIEIEVEANLRNQPAVGEKFPAGIGYGRLSIQGSIEAYFEDFEFYDHFINHETVSLGFDFTDIDYHRYFFTMPALKISSDDISPSGIDTDVMEPMEFVAQRDPALNTEFMIDRFSSTFPSTVA